MKMNIKEILNPSTGKNEFELRFDAKRQNGVRFQRKCKGFKTREEAEKAWDKFYEDCMKHVIERESRRLTFGELVDLHEVAIGKGEVFDQVNIGTAWDRSAIIRLYMADALKKPADEISPFDVRSAFQKMIEQGRSRSRLKFLRGSVNGVYRWAIECGHIKGMTQSPAQGIKLKREEVKKKEVLTLEEIKAFLRMAKEHEHKWYPVWATALLTGMRSGELLALQWSDVDWEKGLISVTRSFSSRIKRIKATKTGMWRTVPMNSDLRRLLSELRLKADGSNFVFPRHPGWEKGEQARILRSFCLATSLKPIKFHTLRACFATSLLRSGVPAIQVMKVGGWTEFKTMQHYIRLSGIDVDGVTDPLQILPLEEVLAQVIEIDSGQRDEAD